MQHVRGAILLVAPLLILISHTLPAQETVPLEGVVLDGETRQPVVGASVYLPALKRGTYTSSKGMFRVPVPRGTHDIRVTSVGYGQYTGKVGAGEKSVTISLTPKPVLSGGVTVTAEINADEIVRRAARRIEEYRRNLGTFQGLLYSKFVTTVEGNAFGAIEDQNRLAVLETFSRSWFDSARGPRIEIIQRRQTANIPASDNIFALGNFFSFYDDDIPILNVSVPSPLNVDAHGRYDFKLAKRSTYGEKGVYIVEVSPNSRVLPAFEGTLTIMEGTFDLVEADLAPSSATAVAFVKELAFLQKFEKFTDGIWQPTYLRITGLANVEIVSGVAEVDIDIDISSTITEAKVNEPIPDSVYGKRIIRVAADADSVRPEFWENNSLSELSTEEKQMYRKVDSLVAAADTTREPEGLGINLNPYLDFNRVGGISAGGSISRRFDRVTLDGTAYYSFGLKKPGGIFSLMIDPLREGDVTARVTGTIFSKILTATSDRSMLPIVNTLTSAFLHRDYYDYYKGDGWSASATVRWYPWNSSDEDEEEEEPEDREPSPFQKSLGLTGTYSSSRQHLLTNTQAASVFLDEPFRPNPAILPGNFTTMRGALSWGETGGTVSIGIAPAVDFGMSLSALTGKEEGSGLEFNGIEGELRTTLPTIPTGYAPMTLQLGLFAGTGSDSLPPQYQYRMRTSLNFIGAFGHFLSPRIGAFGGTEYIAVHGEHDFGDFFWRWLGLPTYEGRGLTMSVGGAAGRFRQANSIGYRPTGDLWYTEAGFGVGKIPVFISNVIFLRFDARWGIGPLGRGKFGMTLGISSPL